MQPTVTRVLANTQTRLEDQSLRGVEAGVTLKRVVELSGTRWQATTNNFQSTRPLNAYSGDVTLLLSNAGVKPYIAGGYGTLCFDDGYLNASGGRPKNRQYGSVDAGAAGDRATDATPVAPTGAANTRPAWCAMPLARRATTLEQGPVVSRDRRRQCSAAASR